MTDIQKSIDESKHDVIGYEEDVHLFFPYELKSLLEQVAKEQKSICEISIGNATTVDSAFSKVRNAPLLTTRLKFDEK